MKNISLLKVTFAVITVTLATLASNFSHADSNNIAEQLVKTTQLNKVIFNKLDINKDSLLSFPEVKASKNIALYENFKKLDIDNNNALSEQEFILFLKNMNAKS